LRAIDELRRGGSTVERPTPLRDYLQAHYVQANIVFIATYFVASIGGILIMMAGWSLVGKFFVGLVGPAGLIAFFVHVFANKPGKEIQHSFELAEIDDDHACKMLMAVLKGAEQPTTVRARAMAALAGRGKWQEAFDALSAAEAWGVLIATGDPVTQLRTIGLVTERGAAAAAQALSRAAQSSCIPVRIAATEALARLGKVAAPPPAAAVPDPARILELVDRIESQGAPVGAYSAPIGPPPSETEEALHHLLKSEALYRAPKATLRRIIALGDRWFAWSEMNGTCAKNHKSDRDYSYLRQLASQELIRRDTWGSVLPNAKPPSAKSSASPGADTLVVSCACGSKFRVKTELVGKRVKCAKCGKLIGVSST
jgi:hypothetical protein